MDKDIRTQLDDLRIRTQSDLHRLWQLLMQPLGFRATSVWVTLIGADGPEFIGAAEVARLAETISWDVLASLSGRLPRIYHRGGAVEAIVPAMW